ncbi:hypothetical protein [Romboutsia ilealis]|uniref:hypothetical protein n=1 Tax=Romboutsia ilealis TaxID=1115758 RepID=UPI00272C11A6|nr:hypothetical protein [Romboutsia ilealis]
MGKVINLEEYKMRKEKNTQLSFDFTLIGKPMSEKDIRERIKDASKRNVVIYGSDDLSGLGDFEDILNIILREMNDK